MIKEAFNEELKQLIENQNRKSDWDQLLTRKDAAAMLRISLVTLSRYQKEGIIPYSRIGRHVYIKKGDILSATESSAILQFIISISYHLSKFRCIQLIAEKAYCQ